MGDKKVFVSYRGIESEKRLAYHIFQRDGCFVYHEFLFWYCNAGGDDYRYFSTREEAESYAKQRGGQDAYAW